MAEAGVLPVCLGPDRVRSVTEVYHSLVSLYMRACPPSCLLLPSVFTYVLYVVPPSPPEMSL